ncbi:DUF6292 family protein [Streptomyces sp. NBC_00669]|uniref:DUF6292 family protein n=1 Tax=Streptomyces sp. NBC_00669 TaxID=2976011 RepID=UPI002E305C10|nr:DUF6292 family protein [Streptomyces sp. NBC_00669]
MPNYHDAHRPYIAAVVNALTTAGIGVSDWFADPNDPRDACITLTTDATEPHYPGQTIVLTWNEEAGWLIGGGEPDELLNWVGELDTRDVLPTPQQVVAAARTAFTTTPPTLYGLAPVYREFEDDNDGFEARLAAYDTPED